MTIVYLIPRSMIFLLMNLSFLLALVLFSQFLCGIHNAMKSYSGKTMMSTVRPIFNFYLFHHLLICLLRCFIVFLICFSLFIYNQCLSLNYLIHFLLLLSTFDLFLIIIGETAHFWDSSINHRSTLYSKYCLVFGLFFNYFLATLFLAIHITIGGENPITIDFCQIIERKSNSNLQQEKSSIPTRILYIFFILLDLLTLLWISISYKDIGKLRHKRLATVFFYTFVFTKFQENQRAKMVNQSLKRLLAVSLFLFSNLIVILPVLTLRVLKISLNDYLRIILIYFTALPWCESITFLFFSEMKYHSMKNTFQTTKTCQLQQQRIGNRLSSYYQS